MHDSVKAGLVVAAVVVLGAAYQSDGNIPFLGGDGPDVSVQVAPPSAYTVLFNNAIWQDGQPVVGTGLAYCSLEGDEAEIVIAGQNIGELGVGEVFATSADGSVIFTEQGGTCSYEKDNYAPLEFRIVK